MSSHEKHKNLIAESGLFSGLHPTMGLASKAMVAAFVVFTIINVDFASDVYSDIKAWIQTTLNWYYITVVCVVLFFAIWVTFSRFGRIRLGSDDERPEFSRFAWFSMLFSAGIGVGLLFWSIAEPIYHFQGNPFLDMEGGAAQSAEAAQIAMRITYFHWGLHGWAIYVIVGLVLAYFSFRRKLPLTMRSALYPIIGDKIYGPIGHAVDLLAIFGTIFGVATSLGLGVSQMNSGLNYLFGMEVSITNQILLVAIISAIATLSAVTGVGRGIKILSEVNIWLSVVLLAFFLFVGPTIFILGFYVTSIGDYLWNLIPMGFWTDPSPKGQWQGSWTIFYWGWWLAWAPFVGMFIARISRGRTIREFMIGVLFVPTSIGFLWLCIFGGTAMHMELYGDGGVINAVNQDLTFALFRTIELLNVEWATWIIAALSTFLIITWFVTSSDSGTLVICTMLSMGDEDPPQRFRVIWGLGEGLVAAVLLLAGGLKALQTASIAAALPFSVILLLMCIGLVKGLLQEEEENQQATAAVPEPQAGD